MDFFKKLFGGGASGSGDSDHAGIYFYVKSNHCDEIVRLRIDRNNDLSLNDEGKGYWVRKMAHGTNFRCRWPVEVTLYFDSNRKFQDSELQGGTLVSAEEYEAWAAEKAGN
jgi:hypothetical protein